MKKIKAKLLELPSLHLLSLNPKRTDVTAEEQERDRRLKEFAVQMLRRRKEDNRELRYKPPYPRKRPREERRAAALAGMYGTMGTQEEDALNVGLMRAAAAGDVEAVKAKLSEGADVDYQDAQGRTSLSHIAARARDEADYEIANVLVLEADADLHLWDRSGKSPLHVAKTARMVRILLQGFKDPELIFRKDNDGLGILQQFFDYENASPEERNDEWEKRRELTGAMNTIDFELEKILGNWFLMSLAPYYKEMRAKNAGETV